MNCLQVHRRSHPASGRAWTFRDQTTCFSQSNANSRDRHLSPRQGLPNHTGGSSGYVGASGVSNGTFQRSSAVWRWLREGIQDWHGLEETSSSPGGPGPSSQGILPPTSLYGHRPCSQYLMPPFSVDCNPPGNESGRKKESRRGVSDKGSNTPGEGEVVFPMEC